MDVHLSNAIQNLDANWASAICTVADRMDLDRKPAELLAYDLETASLRRLIQKPHERIICGLAGPAGVGKSTLAKWIADRPRWRRLLNETTRGQREGEIDGEDARFISDEQFKARAAAGDYVSVVTRPGRGMYGLSRYEINEFTRADCSGLVLIEKPTAVRDVILYARQLASPMVGLLLYLLPPPPVATFSVTGLTARDGQQTTASLEASLGQRQIEEFQSIVDVMAAGDCNVASRAHRRDKTSNKKTWDP